MTVLDRAGLVAAADAGLASVLAVADAHPGAALGDAYLGRRVTDALTHLSGWHELCVGWITAQRSGLPVHFPAEGYAWQQLRELNDAIWAAGSHLSPTEARDALVRSHRDLLTVIDAMTEEELADPALAPWSGGEPAASVAHECLGAHYDWALGVFAAAGLRAE